MFACFQCYHRVDAPNCGSNCSSTDRSSFISLSDLSGKHCCCSFNGLEVLVVQVEMHSERLDVILPFLPYFLPGVGSFLHSSIDDTCVRSYRITFVNTLPSRRKPVHKLCEGKGKDSLKNVQKSVWLWKCHAALYPYDRDEMSPSAFRSPSRWRVTSGNTLFFLSRIVSMHRSWFAILNLRNAPLVFHDMVAEFLLQTPACIHLVGTTPSNTSHPRTSAAISRSKFVMLPGGFAEVTSLYRTSSGQFILHTIGAKAFLPGIHNTPDPSPDASSVAL